MSDPTKRHPSHENALDDWLGCGHRGAGQPRRQGVEVHIASTSPTGRASAGPAGWAPAQGRRSDLAVPRAFRTAGAAAGVSDTGR